MPADPRELHTDGERPAHLSRTCALKYFNPRIDGRLSRAIMQPQSSRKFSGGLYGIAGDCGSEMQRQLLQTKTDLPVVELW